MNYYTITAEHPDLAEPDTLHGSFIRNECKEELECEREQWKEQGYKKFKIVATETTDTPDPEVYEGEIVTSKQLWQQQAPSFNFELDEDELLEEALTRGYVTSMGSGFYLVNSEYGGAA